MRQVRELIRELRRKGFHAIGVLIPIGYYLGLKLPLPGADRMWLTQRDATLILGGITAAYFLIELVRLIDPDANRFIVRRFRFLLRRSEVHTVTGTGYFLLGAFLSVWLFRPVFAILYLIFGDFLAALVGKAIGRIKLIARKSLEGSLACFTVCFVIGVALFWNVTPDLPITLQLAVIGAIAATVAELVPLKINDNLTMPLISGAALMIAAQTIRVEIPLP